MLILGIESASTQVGCAIGGHEGVLASVHSSRAKRHAEVLTPQIDFLHDVHGTSPNTIPFIEGRKAITTSLNFEYVNRWRGQLAYTWYTGGGTNNLMRDRDFASFNVSYAF